MNVHKLALLCGFAAVLTTVGASALLVAQAGRGAPPTPVPPPNAAELIARAKVLAGTDLLEEWQSLCAPTPATIAVRQDKSPGVLEPVKVFDNLYFVGKNSVSATAVKTSAGLILIDTLSNDEEASTILVPGLRQLGLDPKDIKYVVSTHAHGDHMGGIKYLRANFPGFRVVMPEADWAAEATKALRTNIDIGFDQEMKLTLGDYTMTLIKTPGHTIGTVSLLYPVQYQGQTHMVWQWGGGQPHDPVFSQEIVDFFLAKARAARVAVRWQSHTKPDTRGMLAKYKAGQGHPFIFGPEKMGRYMDIIATCKRAGVDAK
jgi:metallo-beta-lactamase class B